MLTLDTTHGGVAPHALATTMTSLDAYRRHIARVATADTLEDPECSVALPRLFTQFSHNDFVKSLKNEALRYVVVIGIGGSNLGTMAVYDALFGRLDALRERSPKMLFLDTVSETALRDVSSALLRCNRAEEFCVVIISKSGTTTESIANADALCSTLAAKWSNVTSRFIAITDEGSKLWHRANEHSMPVVAIPKNVGGRYSVFSPVGLLPLALVGVDVDELQNGAQRAVRACTAQGETNIALTSAAHIFLHYQNEIKIHNTFVFDPDLESLGKWYRQLMAESIGKEHDMEGNAVHCGITPIVSVGSTDLHSMAQLYLGGPADKFTNFITRSGKGQVWNRESPFSHIVENLEGKSFGTIMYAILNGVQSAYEEQGRPYISIELPDQSPATLGYYMQMRMIEMMYLAKLLNTNAFDQPAVELYKKVTRQLLSE